MSKLAIKKRKAGLSHRQKTSSLKTAVSRKGILPKPSRPLHRLFPPPAELSVETFLMMLFGFVLVGLVFLQWDAFHWICPSINLPPNHLNFLLWMGLLLVFLGFRGLPVRPSFEPSHDLPRWGANSILLLVLIGAAFLRLYRGDQPQGRYWDDPAVCIIDPINIAELHIFRLTFDIGHREPMYPYAAAGIACLFPSMKPLLVQRLTSTLFDLAALWVLYRMGREITGKRTVGVLMAAFAAVSKPVLLQVLTGMPALTIPLVVGLILWFQFRLFRKPDLTHFLQWGFIIAFGTYSYITYRPWILFLTVTTLLWVLWRLRAQTTSWPVRIVLPVFAAGVYIFILDRLFYLFPDNPISRFWCQNLKVWILIQAVSGTVLVFLYLSHKGKDRTLLSWGLALLLLGVMVYPLAMNAVITKKIHDLSVIPQSPLQWVKGEFVHKMEANFLDTTRAIFKTGDDRSDMNVEGDPFLDFQAAVLVAFGLVFAVARPSKIKTFLLAGAFVGMVGRLITIDPTSAKIYGALPVFLLFSSWGFENWLQACLAASGRRRFLGSLLLAGLAFCWVSEGQATFQRVYDRWWNLTRPEILISQAIGKDLPEKRVYLAIYEDRVFTSPAVESVTHDGEPIYLLGPENVIRVTSSEIRKDLAVIISGTDKVHLERIQKEFPHAVANPSWVYYQSRSDPPWFYDITIPAGDIPEKPGKMFSYQVVPDTHWLRRVYVCFYGLARGMIRYEDLISPGLPLPPGMGGNSAMAEGIWEAPSDGRYTFSLNSPDAAEFWVDGKRILNWKPDQLTSQHTVIRTVFLKQGTHQVRYLTYLKVNAWFAEINIRSGIGYNQVLGK